jgi:hypothetical protein
MTDFSVYIVSPSDFSLDRIVDSLSLESFFSQPAVWRVESEMNMFRARAVPSVVTSKAANGGQGKTGQRSWPGTWFLG